MGLPKIIAIAGKKGAGKTLVASYLHTRYGYTILNFADELKDLVCDILEISREYLEKTKEYCYDIHLEDEHIQMISDKIGTSPKDVLESLQFKRVFSSPREMLQIIGTEVIRQSNPLWHIQSLNSKIDLIDDTKRYCIADMRFENEKEYCKGALTKTMYIHRNTNTNDKHISENNLSDCDGFDVVLYNNRDIDALVGNIEVCIASFQKSLQN